MTVSAGAKKKKFDREGFIYFLFIVPVIAYILLFKYKPLTGWYYAFTNYKVGMKSEAVTYVGLKNFANLFINEAYMKQVMQVVLNTLIMAFMSIFLSSPLTVTFAICSSR